MKKTDHFEQRFIIQYGVFEVPTLKQYLSANAPHMIRPAPLQTAARDPTTARK